MIHSIQIIDDELGVLAERCTIAEARAFCNEYLCRFEADGWTVRNAGGFWRLTKPGETLRTIGLSLIFTEGYFNVADRF